MILGYIEPKDQTVCHLFSYFEIPEMRFGLSEICNNPK